MASPLHERVDCRICGCRALDHVFALHPTPLANAFVGPEERAEEQPLFPLELVLCRECGHVQLRHVVSPALLFRDYFYVSGTSTVFVEHFRRYAQQLRAFTGLAPASLVVDVGSNDGTLLSQFKAAGMRVLGIDPARDIAAQASRDGIETIGEFFNAALARRLRTERGVCADIMAANNVFAHVDDMHGFLDGVDELLAPHGVFVFEVSYLADVVRGTLFDTIYHEHLSYHTVKPLLRLFADHAMQMVSAHRVDTHGGSLRCIVQRRGGPHQADGSVEQRLREEAAMRLNDTQTYTRMFREVEECGRDLMQRLQDAKAHGRRIAGFGAPAKACTLSYQFGLGPDLIEYVVDDSPKKQGRFTPGHHIPVVGSSWLYDEATRPHECLILAWNFASSIMQKHVAFVEGGGRFLIPLPRVAVHG